MRTAVFTVASLNYAAFARTLMESVRSVHPEWDRHVLLVDKSGDPAGIGGVLFTIITVEELPLPRMREFLFRYGITELNTAVKPYMFGHLRRLGYERVIYLDPDILVLAPLVEVERLLDEGATGVLTPHLTAPLEDGRSPTELDIMRAGAYNLGFLALSSLAPSDAFIAWWQRKLEYGAVAEPERGLFTDQKWVDLAPGMFGGFAILRDPGYNVAYWNLPHRPVRRENTLWFAGEHVLRFFHFSGFNPLNPQPFSKHQDRLTLSTIGDARDLALEYARRVLSHGFAQSAARPYAFGRFLNGTPIPATLRALYRNHAEVREHATDDPFQASEYFTLGELGGLPVILRALWLEHTHLQRAFPDPLGTGRLAYYHWFTDAGGVEVGIPEAFILPVRRTLNAARATGDDVLSSPTASLWGRSLVFLHKRATGGKLSIARLKQYQEVTGPLGFLRLGFEQFRGSRFARRVGITRSAAAPLDPLRAAAQGRAIPSTGLRRARSRYTGLYPEPGKPAWWMGRQASFFVDQPTSPRVRLRGYHHSDLHQRAHAKNTLTISIGFNEGQRHEVTLSHGPFDVTLALEPVPDVAPVTLYIRPDMVFVPKEVGLSDDVRTLSLQISEVTVGTVTIFDAARQISPRAATTLATPAVNVIGYARSEHGIGQSLRQFTLALDAAAIPHAVIDFNVNNNSRMHDLSLDGRIVEEPVHGINVFHINADQMQEAAMHLPAHYFARYNIGFWHWELPELLDEHMEGFSALDEVWVPSGFVQETVAKRSPLPVVRMPHAIHFDVSPGASRAAFGLPERTFLFLMMYDFSSYQARKNPQAALDAFDLAFATRPGGARLIIKTQNAHFHEPDVAILRARLAGRTDVLWINQTLSRQEIYDLLAVCDAFVSLHRSEGYGLGLAEAMFVGKPVIATNWSGNTEFMRPDNSLPVNYSLATIESDIGVYRGGQTWATPDIAHAAFLMHQIATDDALRGRIGAEARRTMRECYSPQIIGQRIRRRLECIQATLS